MGVNRVGGTISVRINGELQRAKGSFKCQPSQFKRSGIAGTNSVHGYKEETIVPYTEGVITDHKDLDIDAMKELDDETITVELATGKTFVLRNSWYAAEAAVDSEEGEIPFRFEGIDGEYI